MATHAAPTKRSPANAARSDQNRPATQKQVSYLHMIAAMVGGLLPDEQAHYLEAAVAGTDSPAMTSVEAHRWIQYVNFTYDLLTGSFAAGTTKWSGPLQEKRGRRFAPAPDGN